MRMGEETKRGEGFGDIGERAGCGKGTGAVGRGPTGGDIGRRTGGDMGR